MKVKGKKVTPTILISKLKNNENFFFKNVLFEEKAEKENILKHKEGYI